MRNNIFANMQESVNLKINNLKEEKPDNDGFETDSFHTDISIEIEIKEKKVEKMNISDDESIISENSNYDDETFNNHLDENKNNDWLVEKENNSIYLEEEINLEDLDEESQNIQLNENNFDWISYTKYYKDLNKLRTKEEAWQHWIDHGKDEDRKIFIFNNEIESVLNVKRDIEKEMEDLKKFDWQAYIHFYPDLSKLNTKEKAFNHWIHHGKNENRKFFIYKKKEMENDEMSSNDLKNNNVNEKDMIKKTEKIEKIDKKEDLKNFDWKSYIKYYPDLVELNTKEKAINHWLKFGKKEKRKYFSLDDNIHDEYQKFDWKTYLKNYEDLKSMNTKKEAWEHWLNHGKKEKRVLYDINKKEMDIYNEIKSKEKKETITIDKINKKIVFKNIYDFYGVHYFGWKCTINQFISFFENQNQNYKENLFFDEWAEKLLLWGNKIQNKEYLDLIKKEDLKFLTFLHNPPCIKWKDKEYKKKMSKHLIMNEEQINKNILNKLDSELNENLEYLFVLSLDHKKHIYHQYPQYKDKIFSIYHPIDMNKNDSEKEFDFELFKTSKNIYHIGWWLRNFKTFIDFVPPEKFKKNILIKNDFMNEWNDHILKYNKVKKINIINELPEEDYLKIFQNSCIFIDLEDSVANNVILECLKFNTPFITRYNKSIEEYVGYDYPLYFEDISELELLTDENIFFTAVKDANEYLKNLNKTHILTDTFNKKLSYDLNKFKIKSFTKKLTWICFLSESFSETLIDHLVQNFIQQEEQETIQLLFILDYSINMEELQEKSFFQYSNIKFLNIENQDDFMKNIETEFILITQLNDKYKKNYSKFCIQYLENKLNADIIFSSFKYISRNLSDNEKEKESKYNKYKEGLYFLDDLEMVNGLESNELPNSGFVFRKSMTDLIDYSFLFMNIKEMYSLFIKNNLNVFCISEKPFFIKY